jgi:hypothetical protein
MEEGIMKLSLKVCVLPLQEEKEKPFVTCSPECWEKCEREIIALIYPAADAVKLAKRGVCPGCFKPIKKGV